jgi:methylthioribulose-1-phosphate dehydratase
LLRQIPLAGGQTLIFHPEANQTFATAALALAELGRQFYSRGWVMGTSGNFSAVLYPEPLLVAITPSGVDKGRLEPEQILAIDATGSVIEGAGRPSDETKLHLAVIRAREAGAVLHTHSIWSTLLSEAHASAGGLAIKGYEMLKGLAGVTSHEHCEWLPVIENSQDMAALSLAVERMLERNPATHGFLLRRHGLYTWGRDLSEARRHVEILEFLLEVAARADRRGEWYGDT